MKHSFDDDEEEFRTLPGPRSVMRSMLRAFLVAAILGGTLSLFFFYFVLKDLAIFDDSNTQLTSLLTMKQQNNTLVFDQKGDMIAELFSADHIYYPIDKIPEPMIQAVLSIEDRSFWQHPGFDPKGILRAVWVHLTKSKGGYQQGASTITQQVVRYFLLPKEKTIARKLKEIVLAVKLERHLPKKKILEIYTNSLFLGSGAFGVGAAAKRFFGRDLDQLQLHEMAVIAGLFQAPSLYNPHRNPEKARERQLKVLFSMMKNGYLSRKDMESWARKPLVYKVYDPWKRKLAPYFVDYVIEDAKKILETKNIKNQGLKIYTTLDLQLQALAEESIQWGDPLYKRAERESPRDARPSVEAALLATDPRNGEVLAMVGGRNYKASQFNRTYQSMRQPGSAFKPIVYSLALESGYRWSDVVFVSPLTLGDGYRPRNQEDDYLTEATFLRAFYRSMNSPTLQIGEKLGLSAILPHARKLGVESFIKPELGSILGASEVTMFDLARVYGVFADEGRRHKVSAIRQIKDQNDEILYTAPTEETEQALSREVAYLMVEGMRQVLIRGTGSQAGELSSWAVGKTGTSNDSKDNWFNGFGRNLVTIVWCGSDTSVPLSGWAQGAHLSLPVWMHFMKAAHPLRPQEDFVAPDDVIRFQVNDRLGNVNSSGVSMWFLKSAPPSEGPSMQPVDDEASFRNPFAK